MDEWWTNKSVPPSSGVMKPKPFSSENHFTVPYAMSVTSTALSAANAEELLRQLAGGTRCVVHRAGCPASSHGSSAEESATVNDGRSPPGAGSRSLHHLGL